MPVINVLPKNIAELIAAGEVIERPSSVIKELVENSIDAGARSIIVEIQNGGTTFMRVTDNGCGIDEGDVKKAFLRHATSKISVADDLDAIGTLGFRGEALASVCAVAKVELITKSRGSSTGTRYVIEGGEERDFSPAGCPDGTTIIVRDIFYNVPARMKFLKKDVSEGNAVSTLMDRIALSHPEISFTLIRDGKQVLKTQGDGNLATAVYQVFGKSFFNSLIEVDYTLGGIHVDGFVTKPVSSVKANRSMQMFYINGRYVRTKTGMAALEQAYRGSVMTGKFPSCVLRLEMNCSMLDVNVHPAKLEVRFTNESPVYESVYHAVNSAVMKYDPRNEGTAARTADPRHMAPPVDRAEQPAFSFANASQSVLPDALKNRSSSADDDIPVYMPPRAKQSAVMSDVRTGYTGIFASALDASVRNALPKARHIIEIEDIADESDKAPVKPPVTDSSDDDGLPPVPEKEEVQNPDTSSAPDNAEEIPPKPETLTQPEAPAVEENGTNAQARIVDEEDMPVPFRYIGQAFSTYIILEYDSDRLMFIDKHAAHERLLYERLKAGSDGKAAQYLLEPVAVSMDAEECRIVLENKDALLGAGFEVDAFGDKTILVRSVPVFMDKLEVSREFSEIADYLCRHKKVIISEKMDWIIANTACRAAIKAGNVSTDDELIELALELERNPEIRTCPHGRPIYFFMTKYEMEKAFKRIV